MKLYLLSQNEVSGYDTYDSIVVVAENEEEAKNISPYNKDLSEVTGSYDTWVGKDNIDKIKVTYLGEAKEGLEKGVIIHSFNAG